MLTLSLQRSPVYGAAGQLSASKYHHWASLIIFTAPAQIPLFPPYAQCPDHTMGTERDRVPISSMLKMTPPKPQVSSFSPEQPPLPPPTWLSFLQRTATVEEPPVTGCPALPCQADFQPFPSQHSDCDL